MTGCEFSPATVVLTEAQTTQFKRYRRAYGHWRPETRALHRKSGAKFPQPHTVLSMETANPSIRQRQATGHAFRHGALHMTDQPLHFDEGPGETGSTRVAQPATARSSSPSCPCRPTKCSCRARHVRSTCGTSYHMDLGRAAAGLSVVRGHGGPRAGGALRGSSAATSLRHTCLDRPQPVSVFRGREPHRGHGAAARRGTATIGKIPAKVSVLMSGTFRGPWIQKGGGRCQNRQFETNMAK